MQLKEEAIFTLKFDGKPVVNELGTLEQKLQEIKATQKDVEHGTQEWAENKTQIKELEASIKAVREEMGVSGMTVQQLQGYYRQLNSEIQKLTPGTEEYKKKAADLQEVNTAIANHRATIRGVIDEVDQSKSVWSQMKDWVSSAFTVVAILEFGKAVVNWVGDSIKEFRDYQTAAQQLSAITGLVGKDLDYLKQQAKDTGPAFGMTAAEMLKAYQIMGSAKPELLAQKEALAAITKEAIILSQASQMELEPAAKAVAESLNQFGKGADQANRFVNVMAAGAKEGAAEISEMTASLKASGTVAASSKLSFEQTNAVLQSMSTIALKGEQAGTGLRNVLLKLSAGAKETNPEIVGLDTALENLGKKNLSTAEMTKLFGSENVVAAKHIVEHRKEIAELTTKLTSTQEAYSQAAKNTQTVDYQTKQATATLSLMKTELGSGLEPMLVKVLQGFVAFINTIRAVPEFVRENKDSFIALGVAILAFNGHLIAATAASIAQAAAEKARQIWTTSATGAQWLLNAALTANPIGLVVSAVALLVAGFITLYNHSTTVRGGISGLFSALKVAAGQLVLFWQAITALNFADAAKIITEGGKKIAEGFNKGYQDEVKKGQPGQLTDHGAHVGKLTGISTAGAKEAALSEISEHAGGLSKKELAAQKLRESEAKKAADAAKKEADEAVKANNDGLKQIETARIESIQDDLTREIAKIRARRDAEVEAAMASKASAETKAVWETALNAKMVRDIADAQEKARLKNEKDEADTAKRTLDLKIKIAGDEKADKIQKLDDVAAKLRAEVQKEITDETEKASLLKQINDNLIAGKAKVEEDYRKKKSQEDKALLDAQYQATLADAEARLLLAGDNATKIYTAKKDKLEAEYQFNKAKLQREADEEKAKNADLIQDHDKRAQADKAIDDRLKSQLTANDLKYETDKTALSEEKTAARKKNQEEFFSAIKGLMQGDFTTFTDLLAKKLSGEKKQLTDSQKANVDKIDAVGSYSIQAVNALSALNTAALNKELGNITKEKTTQLAAWKEKYDKGLINKDQYEAGVDKINKEADTKTKEAQLAAFKRQQKLDIALAIINGLQAALKSLAMLGWPFGLIAAAGAAVSAGIQIAAIKSQQPPSMARGGTIKNAGVPEGPRHGSRYGDSGLAITRRDTGEEVAEMEGGEPIMVLSRNTYKNNRQVVDSLLHSSLHRNGAPVMARGGIMFEDGGGYSQADHESSVYNGSSGASTSQPTPGSAPDYEPSPPADSGGGGSWMDDAGASADELDNSSYQAEVDKSTALMEAIGKNTLATVEGIKLVADTLTRLQQQIQTSSTTQQSALATLFASLRADTQRGFTGLASDNSAQMAALQSAIHTDLVSLQGTMKLELPSLGKDLQDELVTLRQAVALGLVLLRQGINLDVMSLQQVTATGFDQLANRVHDDLTLLDMNMDANLDSLTRNVHADLIQMQTTQSVQQAQLRSDTNQHFTTLQTILQTELQTLQQTTHTDLAALATANTSELRILQDILNRTKNEQGYQSTLLRVISEKNLSVSVQSIVSVWNQIDVVVDKSNLK